MAAATVATAATATTAATAATAVATTTIPDSKVHAGWHQKPRL